MMPRVLHSPGTLSAPLDMRQPTTSVPSLRLSRANIKLNECSSVNTKNMSFSSPYAIV